MSEKAGCGRPCECFGGVGGIGADFEEVGVCLRGGGDRSGGWPGVALGVGAGRGLTGGDGQGEEGACARLPGLSKPAEAQCL
jgi:hypothetical protein